MWSAPRSANTWRWCSRRPARRGGSSSRPVRLHVGFGLVLGANGKEARLPRRRDDQTRRPAHRGRGPRGRTRQSRTGCRTRAEVAQAVGIGAIKYVDLSSDRGKDYVFTWAKMLSFAGDTGAYLQYTYTRIQAIFPPGQRHAGTVTPPSCSANPPSARSPWNCSRPGRDRRGRGDAAVPQAHGPPPGGRRRIPPTSTRSVRCFKAPDDVRSSRLALCDLTGRTIALGLSLLGIVAPNRM